MADNLPRPSTPGPWLAYGDDVLATYRGRIETLAMLDGDGTDDPVADAEADLMRAVVQAAEAYRDFFTKPYSGTREMLLNPLIRAVDTYRAARKEDDRG